MVVTCFMLHLKRYYTLLKVKTFGLHRYPKPDQLLSLVAVAVETGRMTHPHPTGFLGAVASALFTAYAVQRRPLTTWGLGLLNEACSIAKVFVQNRSFAVEETERDWAYFCDKWLWYGTWHIMFYTYYITTDVGVDALCLQVPGFEGHL